MSTTALLPTALVLFGFIHVVSSGYSWGGGPHKPWATSPEFESTPQNIVVPPGQTAVLPCRVRNLSDKTVSWIRRTDLHIISSGPFIFTGDSRFLVLHPDGDHAAWGLQLRKPEPKDQGIYECQINTDPTMKRAVLLTVTERSTHLDVTQKDDSRAYDTETAMIAGPKERYVKVGSSIRLSCQFRIPQTGRSLPNRHSLVEWLHDNNPLGFRTGGAGVRVDSQKDGNEVVSHVTLLVVTHSDSGLYTCSPYHGKPSTITLFVIDGEHSEAMQGEYSAGSRIKTGVFLGLPALILLLYTAA